MLIGLTGDSSTGVMAQVGKDEIANILIRRRGYQRIAFADKMKDALYALNPWITPRIPITEGNYALKDALEAFPSGTWSLQHVVDRIGWDLAKQIPEVRGLLQRFGTEAGRNVIAPDVWIQAAFNDIPKYSLNRIVVSDVRFDNEADWIREHGGQMVHVSRPGIDAPNSHSSEQGVIARPGDWEICNDGTLAQLDIKVMGLLESMARVI